MKKVWWLLLLLIIPTVSAVTIADWPKFFVTNGKFSAKYVVGEEAPALDVVSATVISTSLAKFENVTTEVGTSTLDIEIVNITRHNAIVVGSPCENRAAAELMGNPSPCFKDLGGSIGYIKLYQHNGRVQLLITGLDEKDRHAAAKFLAEKSVAGINTTEYLVSSNSGSVPAFFEQKLKAKNESKNLTAFNVTKPAPVANITNVTEAPKNVTEKKVGAYEPLKEIPKKKKLGFWASIWAWIAGLFT